MADKDRRKEPRYDAHSALVLLDNTVGFIEDISTTGMLAAIPGNGAKLIGDHDVAVVINRRMTPVKARVIERRGTDIVALAFARPLTDDEIGYMKHVDDRL